MISAIIAAGGAGIRFGSTIPKQFTVLKEKEVILYSLEIFEGIEEIDKVIVAVNPSFTRKLAEIIKKQKLKKVTWVKGGHERMESVWNALSKVKTEYVLVHDAVRPCISTNLVKRVIRGMFKYGACIPVIPVAETVKKVQKNTIEKTIPRNKLYISQTPQGFRTSLLLKGYKTALKNGIKLTDEAMALEITGYPVKVVKGEKKNIKITFKEDMEIARCFLK